jgi:hypothetical protein
MLGRAATKTILVHAWFKGSYAGYGQFIGGSKVIHRWFKGNITTPLHCHKRNGHKNPSFRRHGFYCCPAAQHYPKSGYELLPRGAKGK